MKASVMKKESEVPQVTDENKDNLLNKALHVGAQAANLGHEALRFKNQVSHAVTDALEDGKREARRAMKRGVSAAEDLVDDTAHRVKHHPIRSIAIAFGVGALFGCIVTSVTRKLIKA